MGYLSYNHDDSKPLCGKEDVAVEVISGAAGAFKVDHIENHCEPWTILTHKKPQKGWIPYNPRIMWAKDVSLNLFTRFPPCDCGSGDKIIGKFVGKIDRRKTDPFFARTLMSKFDIKRRVKLLTSKLSNDPKLKQITEKRTKIPIASFRDAITSAIDSHQECGTTALHIGEKKRPLVQVTNQHLGPGKLSVISSTFIIKRMFFYNYYQLGFFWPKYKFVFVIVILSIKDLLHQRFKKIMRVVQDLECVWRAQLFARASGEIYNNTNSGAGEGRA